MKTTIYKITFQDDKIIITNNRPQIADEYNRIYKDKENFKPININTINGMLYNKNKLKKDIKTFERFNYDDYYKNYIDAYKQKLTESNKNYTERTEKTKINNLLNLIFDTECYYTNHNKDKNEMIDRIQQTIKIC